MNTPENQLQAAPSRVAVQARNGVILSNMDEMARFAAALFKSGLAPKGFPNEQACFISIQMGAELGLPPMASVQNIAVINGRPSLWGDAQLAVVRSTGELEEFDEWFEVSGKRVERPPHDLGEEVTAVCRVKRKGFGPQVGTFSVKEAKRADLWGKSGPWQQYPTRMLRFRARSFVLRDNFGDALRGLLTAEEVSDLPPMKNADVVSDSPAGEGVKFGDPSPASNRRWPAANKEDAPAPTLFPVPPPDETPASEPPVVEEVKPSVFTLAKVVQKPVRSGPQAGKHYDYLTLRREDGSEVNAAWFGTPLTAEAVGTTLAVELEITPKGNRAKSLTSSPA